MVKNAFQHDSVEIYLNGLEYCPHFINCAESRLYQKILAALKIDIIRR